MTCSLPVSFALYGVELATYIECALETNHHRGMGESKNRSSPTRAAARSPEKPDHTFTRFTTMVHKALMLGPAVLYSNKNPIDCSSHPGSVGHGQPVIESEEYAKTHPSRAETPMTSKLAIRSLRWCISDDESYSYVLLEFSILFWNHSS